MFDADRWQEIIETVRANKLRTALTALGVFWGIFMLLVMLGSGNGLQNGIHQSMSGRSTNAVYLWGQRTTMPYEGMPPGRVVRFDIRDIEAIGREVEGIEHLAPRNQLGGFRGGATVNRDDRTSSFTIMGEHPEIQHIETMTLTSGRFLNHLDIVDRRKVAVIGSRVREILFDPDESAIGASIQINGIYFLVVGTFEPARTGDMAERQSQTIFVPFATFQQAFNFGDRVRWFALSALPDQDASRVEADVRALLAARHKIHPDDEQAIGSSNAQKEFEKFLSLFLGIRIFIWIVGIVTLLSGVVGVSNIMLIIVRERTREIGVRKALGATPASIITTIVQEAVVLTSLAGYLGVVAGVGALELINRLGIESHAFASPSVDFDVALVATAILIVAGALAGIFPAWQAASVRPVEALRAE